MKIKKILILGSNEKFSIEKMYERAFKSLKFKTNFLHLYSLRQNILSKFFWKYFRFYYFFLMRKKILKYIKKHNQFDLIVIFKGLYLKENFVNKIKSFSPKSKCINIFTDDPFDIDYYKDISNMNILKTINEFDNLYIFSRKILKKIKLKYPKSSISYLPFAHDSFIHKKKNTTKIDYDISFVGTADKKRYDFICKLKNFKIIIAGNGWSKINLPKNIKFVSGVEAKKYSSIVSSSRVSLNILRDQNSDSHNMKTFEIPSMGGLLLTKKNKDQNNFFPNNFACIMYRNINEAKLAINSVVNNHRKYKLIKNNAYKIAKKHSYKERVKYILKTLNGR